MQELILSSDDDSGSPRQARLDSISQLLTYSRNEDRRENFLYNTPEQKTTKMPPKPFPKPYK